MKPQDLVVALALCEERGHRYVDLSSELRLSTSEAHASVRRLQDAGLVNPERQIIRHALMELLLHGVKYVFAAQPGGLVLGVPTGAAAPALQADFPAPDPAPWVWPWPEGTVRGLAIEPLYKTAPAAAMHNPRLYELLALVDALRAGRARERNLAEARLKALLL